MAVGPYALTPKLEQLVTKPEALSQRLNRWRAERMIRRSAEAALRAGDLRGTVQALSRFDMVPEPGPYRVMVESYFRPQFREARPRARLDVVARYLPALAAADSIGTFATELRSKLRGPMVGGFRPQIQQASNQELRHLSASASEAAQRAGQLENRAHLRILAAEALDVVALQTHDTNDINAATRAHQRALEDAKLALEFGAGPHIIVDDTLGQSIATRVPSTEPDHELQEYVSRADDPARAVAHQLKLTAEASPGQKLHAAFALLPSARSEKAATVVVNEIRAALRTDPGLEQTFIDETLKVAATPLTREQATALEALATDFLDAHATAATDPGAKQYFRDTLADIRKLMTPALDGSTTPDRSGVSVSK